MPSRGLILTECRTDRFARIRNAAPRRGIAVPAVLVTLVLVTLLTRGLTILATSSYDVVTLQNLRVQTDWILSAGLNRAAMALVTPGDPLREALFDGRDVAWSFTGRTLTLRMENESRKVDVNAADAGLVIARMARVLGNRSDSLLQEAELRLQEARLRHQPLAAPELLLPLDLRVGPIGSALRQALTVFSGQAVPSAPPSSLTRGPDDDTENAAEGTRQSASSAPSLSRPIYRLIATLQLSGARPGVGTPLRDITLMLSANDQKVFRIVDGHL